MNGKSEKVHGKSMLSKVMIPMLILGILEVAVFAIVMLVSGELTYIICLSKRQPTEQAMWSICSIRRPRRYMRLRWR